MLIMNNQLNNVEEIRIVALLARGDTYIGIREQIAEEFGRHLSDMTIRKVKKRNKDNLKLIKERIVAKEAYRAENIRDKANNLINARLTQADHDVNVLQQAYDDYVNGNMDYKEYMALTRRYQMVSLPELVSVSKEMHQQNKDEEAETKAPAKDLDILAKALQTGDEVVLNQIIFKGKQ